MGVPGVRSGNPGCSIVFKGGHKNIVHKSISYNSINILQQCKLAVLIALSKANVFNQEP